MRGRPNRPWSSGRQGSGRDHGIRPSGQDGQARPARCRERPGFRSAAGGTGSRTGADRRRRSRHSRHAAAERSGEGTRRGRPFAGGRHRTLAACRRRASRLWQSPASTGAVADGLLCGRRSGELRGPVRGDQELAKRGRSRGTAGALTTAALRHLSSGCAKGVRKRGCLPRMGALAMGRKCAADGRSHLFGPDLRNGNCGSRRSRSARRGGRGRAGPVLVTVLRPGRHRILGGGKRSGRACRGYTSSERYCAGR